jgi:hypothetical protein
MNAILGVKYVVDRGPDLPRLPPLYYENIGTFGAFQLYENKKVLPVGFMARDRENKFNPLVSGLNPVAVKNIIAAELSGFDAPLYTLLGTCSCCISASVSEAVNLQVSLDGNSFHYTAAEGLTHRHEMMFSLEYVITEAKPTYLTVSGTFIAYVRVLVNGAGLRGSPHGNAVGQGMETVYLGYLQPGDRVAVTLGIKNLLAENKKLPAETGNLNRNPLFLLGLTDRGREDYPAQQRGTGHVYLHQLNESIFDEVYTALSASPLNVSSYGATYIQGDINVLEDGLLFLSVPYDRRWHVYVNGQVHKAERVLGAFIGIPLSAGQYEIRMEYRPVGVVPSVLVSVLALAGVLAWPAFRRMKQPRK